MDLTPTRILIGGAITSLWSLSLVVPAAGWGNSPVEVEPGWHILAIGWIGLLDRQFGWFANIFLLLSMPLAIGLRRPSKFLFPALSFFILLSAVQTLGWTEVQTNSGRYPVSMGPGYYLWLVALLAQSLWLFLRTMASWGDSGESDLS